MFKNFQIICLLLMLNLSACSYQLQQESAFPELKEIDLLISEPELRQNLQNDLEKLSIKIRANSAVKLSIYQYKLQKTTLAQSENNHGNFLQSSFILKLEENDNTLFNKEISNQIFINFNKNEILGNLKEEMHLKKELQNKDIQAIKLILSAFYEN